MESAPTERRMLRVIAGHPVSFIKGTIEPFSIRIVCDNSHSGLGTNCTQTSLTHNGNVSGTMRQGDREDTINFTKGGVRQLEFF